jgi:hypothetical protein
VLVHHNLPADDATKLTALITEKLPCKAPPMLQAGTPRRRTPMEINSAAENNYEEIVRTRGRPRERGTYQRC